MAYAELIKDDIVVEVPWAEQNLPAEIPGLKYRASDKTWHGKATWALCISLRGVFGGKLELGLELVAWAKNERKRWVDPALDLRERIIPESEFYAPVDERLFPHQNVGVQFLTNESALLCDSMGTGKSCQILCSLKDIYERTLLEILPTLIICPNSVKHNWSNEAKMWFPDLNSYVIGGTATERRRTLHEAKYDSNALVIINYESVRIHSRLAPYGSIRLTRCTECGGHDETVKTSRCEVHTKELNDIPFGAVICDEAHKMKDPKAKQTRACWAVMHQSTVQRRWALTGTPVANSVEDLWPIMHGIAPDDFPNRSKFIDRFALIQYNRFAGTEVVGIRPDRREEFEKIVHPRMRRMIKDVVLPDLPKKIRTVREAPMTNKQKKAYKEMHEHLFADLGGGDIVLAGNNMVKAIRLLQFSSTFAQVNDDYSLTLSEPSPKLDVLEEILDEMGSRQLAVCALSRQLIDLAAVRLDKRGTPYCLLTGAVPQKERQDNIDNFQSGKAQVMLFTVGAGGVGVNMTAADTIVFLQRSWSMIENKQAEDRVHRVGSEEHESINVVDIVAPGTIEVAQIRALAAKLAAQEDVVQDASQRMAHGIDGVDDTIPLTFN